MAYWPFAGPFELLVALTLLQDEPGVVGMLEPHHAVPVRGYDRSKLGSLQAQFVEGNVVGHAYAESGYAGPNRIVLRRSFSTTACAKSTPARLARCTR